MRIARAHHTSTTFSDTPSNRLSGNPIALTRSSLTISASSVSSCSGPGSSFSSCRKLRAPAAPASPSLFGSGLGTAIRSSSATADEAGNRRIVVAVNSRSNSASAAPASRSICSGVGGSVRSSRQRASSAARNRSRDVSTGQILSASQNVSLSSSATVGSRKPWNRRICAR